MTSVEDGPGDTLRVRVPAKINLHLAVGPRRADGYHDIVSVLQTISLHDTLWVHRHDDAHAAHPSARRLMRVSLTLDGDGESAGVPADASNLVLVAARRLMDHLGIGMDEDGSGPWSRMHLTKRIPVAAGMAGGSADAAAALVGLNRLWGADLTLGALCDIAATVGSDVPFCVVGGTGLATGTGTSVARVLTRGTTHWVIGIDRAPLSTADVYAAFDRLEPPAPSSPDRALHALRMGDLEGLAGALHNELEPAAIALRPMLAERREAMLRAGAIAAIVSGSGPTLLGLARDALHARRLAALLEEHFDMVEVAAAPAGGPEILAGRAA
jgi:4-diphosphocytidyl-2-C-methyl-D-erythritol kinase